MPKKTKKEKLLAQQRRKNLPAHAARPASVPIAADTISSPYQFHISNQKKIHQMESDDTVELIAIKRDLARTLTLALVAIGIEVSLYWLLRVK